MKAEWVVWKKRFLKFKIKIGASKELALKNASENSIGSEYEDGCVDDSVGKDDEEEEKKESSEEEEENPA